MKRTHKLMVAAAVAGIFSAQSASATTITWDYNFKTTPDGGAGAISPVAQLVLEDVTSLGLVNGSNVDGVKFTLSNIATSVYDNPAKPGRTFINGLFLNASSTAPFETEWTHEQLPGGDATMTTPEFGEDEHPNEYDYSIEVNFERDIPGQNALKEGESISWIFYNFDGGPTVAVSDFLFAGTDNPVPGPDASFPQEVWSTIKIRGVNPAQGELVFGRETIHVVAAPAAVPVPAALLLFLSAIAGLGFYRRRKG